MWRHKANCKSTKYLIAPKSTGNNYYGSQDMFSPTKRSRGISLTDDNTGSSLANDMHLSVADPGGGSVAAKSSVSPSSSTNSVPSQSGSSSNVLVAGSSSAAVGQMRALFAPTASSSGFSSTPKLHPPRKPRSGSLGSRPRTGSISSASSSSSKGAAVEGLARGGSRLQANKVNPITVS